MNHISHPQSGHADAINPGHVSAADWRCRKFLMTLRGARHNRCHNEIVGRMTGDALLRVSKSIYSCGPGRQGMTMSPSPYPAYQRGTRVGVSQAVAAGRLHDFAPPLPIPADVLSAAVICAVASSRRGDHAIADPVRADQL